MYKIHCFDCKACSKTDNRDGAFTCYRTKITRKPTDAPCNLFTIRYTNEKYYTKEV